MNLVLGDVLETIYVVDEDDEDEEIRVSDQKGRSPILKLVLTRSADGYEEIRDAIRSR